MDQTQCRHACACPYPLLFSLSFLVPVHVNVHVPPNVCVHAHIHVEGGLLDMST